LPDNTPPSAGFLAEHTAWNLGGAVFVQQRTGAYSYARPDAMLRNSPIDHWQIIIPRSGKSWTEVDGNVVLGEPGRAVLRSLGYPFSGRATESECLTIYLPRRLFENCPSILDAANNRSLLGNVGDLLLDYVNSVEARLDSLGEGEPQLIVHMIRDLVYGCLSKSGTRDADTELEARRVALVERIRQYVQANVGAQDLSVDTLAKAVGVSRTKLYHLYKSEGGVLRYVQRRRLLAGHVALSDASDRRHISEIAESVGFSSAASFSRAFKKEFGYSPSAAAKAAPSADLVVPVSRADQGGDASFENWLTSLGS
jgi:AraC-like DNA-binding protein